MHVLAARVLLRPSDFAASVAFYEQQLGLRRFREWDGGVVYFLGGGYLELTGGGGGPPPPPGQPPFVRLWLQVADAAAAHAELQAAGVAIVAAPERKPWGLIEMEIDDPDGLRLVVVEVPADHPLRRRPAGT